MINRNKDSDPTTTNWNSQRAATLFSAPQGHSVLSPLVRVAISSPLGVFAYLRGVKDTRITAKALNVVT